MLIVLTGVTATGKTDLSLELAETIGGEIISADSMMVYRHMDIGTAKPTKEERKRINHYLIDIVDPSEDFTVKDFISEADKAVNEIIKKGKIPMVVGGTWLYIQSLLFGLTDAPEGNFKLREKLYRFDSEELYSKLKRVDPDYADKIHVNDKKRIVRALEVYLTSKKPFSYYLSKHNFEERRYDFIGFILERDRDELMVRIEKRVEKMFKEGLIDEVKFLVEMGYENFLTSSQAIGYKEVVPYLKGEVTLDEAKDQVVKNTKRFAKRQIRTFRSKFKNPNMWNRVDMSNYTNREVLYKIIEKIKSLRGGT